ncbi:ABC transporter ATP-binding protein [Promethearchaeum syntrophicum]|uniref:ABC transporter ATP-binding protein n=1 Tax=Promethearchaeum syntrophicum TaxID=2594042 RepID=A0A5B9DAZ1_9ARCH|nr:ABC transporter ATP-binding protein [Candidatus Prometheoarchaeum syntrophicum]QEE16282.1 putative ABC transporter ATP-binding protein [Candidatus Prometheoarchaeum syntrophicum]
MSINNISTKDYSRWLFIHIWHHPVLLILNLIGIIAVTFSRVIIPVRIGSILDSIIDPNFSGNLILMVSVLFGMYIIRNIIEYATWMIGHNLGSKTEMSMRREFFETVQQKPLKFHDQVKTGDLQALATNDLRVINTMIAHGSFYIYPFIQSIIAIGLSYQSFNYRMALLLFPFIVVYVYFVLQYRKKLTPFSKQALSKHAEVTVALQESLNGIQITRAFCAEPIEIRKFKEVVKAYRENWLGENRVQAKFFPLLVIYAAIGTSFVYGCFLIQRNMMTIGELTAINLLLLTLIQPTEMIFWATKDMIGGFGASERLFSNIVTGKVESSLKEGILPTSTFQGKIEFKNVSFTYPNNNGRNPVVLKNLNFSIKPNQKVALVGPTGCGKTTLAKLLLRLYRPDKGEILLDDQNIHDFPLKNVRQNIGLIEQDVFLFSHSIEENIKFGNPEANHEEVLKVAKLAHVHDFVRTLPLEYKTIVGERGTRLSGGEKQRIAIARAFLTDPDILILDDSMSAIDSETEEKIGKAISNILKNRTTLIITHRLHTIRTSDLILVLKNGEIVAQGDHDFLLKTSTDYSKIFGNQTIYQEKNKLEGNT